MATKIINNRVNFASVKNPYPYPDFLDVQLKSFSDFLQLDTPPEERKNDGLYKVFAENFPITDTRNNFVLEFLDYFIDPPRYTIAECLERGLTYSVPLKAKMKLYCTDPDHEDFGTFIQDVFLGTIPYMTANGTFVINGAERVVVSQLHRSPGVFFGQGQHANGTMLYSARIIPFKGSWIEFSTDINNVMFAYIDRKKKLPVTTMLRAIGYETDKDILQIFDLCEDVKVTKKNLKDAIGRKLAGNVMKTWNEDFADEDTGEVVSIERNEIVVERETELTADNIDAILESGVSSILLHKDEEMANKYSIIFNTLQKDPSHSEIEAVNYIYRQLRNADAADDASAREVFQNLFFSDKRYDLGEVGRYRINKKLGLTTDSDVRVLTKEDIIEIIKYLIKLINSNATVDDIDHLSNRRVRTVGEQLANQFSIGLARMARTIRERMNVRDNEVFQPTDLINAKTISSVINSFFGTNPLSQFMDQTNPLAEVTHKRRLSALGPGGLSRERAGFEVRDVHYTHYGRLCPIESPEGPNIGLISYLATYAKINKYGFVEAPYRKVDKATGKGISGAVFLLYDSNHNPIGEYVTNQDGYIYADEGLADGRYYLREIKAAPGYVLDPELKTIYVRYGSTTEIEWSNTAECGQIQIIKKSADDNATNGLPAGTLLEGAVFEIYDKAGNVVDTIKSDRNGRAVSKTLPLSRYTVREIKAPANYSINPTVMTAYLEHEGQIATFEVQDSSVSTGISIKKTGPVQAVPGQPIRYVFSQIKNSSNVALDSFYWRDQLPAQVTLSKIVTGSYNQPLSYKVVYKTNLSGDYRTLADNLSTSKVYVLDTRPAVLGLAANERVTEVMFVFGNVKAGFAQVETPYIYATARSGLANNASVVNVADVGGLYNGQWIQAVSRWLTTVYTKTTVKLPKTGY